MIRGLRTVYLFVVNIFWYCIKSHGVHTLHRQWCSFTLALWQMTNNDQIRNRSVSSSAFSRTNLQQYHKNPRMQNIWITSDLSFLLFHDICPPHLLFCVLFYLVLYFILLPRYWVSYRTETLAQSFQMSWIMSVVIWVSQFVPYKVGVYCCLHFSWVDFNGSEEVSNSGGSISVGKEKWIEYRVPIDSVI